MKLLIHQPGTANDLEIAESDWPSYQQSGWMLLGYVPVPVKPKPVPPPIRKK